MQRVNCALMIVMRCCEVERAELPSIPVSLRQVYWFMRFGTASVCRCPPKSKLDARQIADLIQWIKSGAPWPNHSSNPAGIEQATVDYELTDDERNFWAFRPPSQHRLPKVDDHAWIESPIDQFVLANLESRQWRPAMIADKRTLIRRATFDLFGLPPSPQEVADFLADNRPGAFARLVDRLLGSPRYGERWGRHWLDVARYADSNGLDENLAFGNAYRYRDYVIRSLNIDKPFDRFIFEQLAGDLLEATSSFDPIIATGFLSLGAKMLAEDDPVKMQMDIIDEQVDTVGRALMGLTLGLRSLSRPQIRSRSDHGLLLNRRDLQKHENHGTLQCGRKVAGTRS